MSAYADKGCTVYWCVVCGPCLQLHEGKRSLTVHQDMPHPDTLIYEDEDNPQ